MRIPTWYEAERRSDIGGREGLTPLESFVYDNEPAGTEHEQKFREGLQAVVDWCLKGAP